MNNILALLLILHVVFFQIATAQPQESKPNVLLIFTDQQNIEMMSAMGNKNLFTPNMDRLAKRGVMFTNAYCTSPVCGPARSSIISGRMPHETGVEWNGDSMNGEVKNVGELFRGAGYETVWAGKWHLPESFPQRAQSRQKGIVGFDLLPFRDPEIENWMLGAETDPPLTKAVVKYLDDYNMEQPFFLAVSYHNPHDICFYSRKDGWVTEEDSLLDIRYYGFEYQLPDVVGTHPSEFENLPDLPDNFAVDENEPEFILDKRKWGHHMEYGLETHLAYHEFDSLEWRGYLNAYYRLTEMVDLEIGKVLDALDNNGFGENTIIAFTSDHGDGAAGHQWSTKNSLYKESAMVPMIVSYPGMIPADRVDSTHLVSQIDITPTLCDLAGIPSPDGFTGESMKAILTEPGVEWRVFVVVELADYKPDQSRKGRMVRSAEYKYNVFTTGARNEQLFQLRSDPGESTNLAFDPAYENELQKHKTFLKQWMTKTNDNFELRN